MFSVRRQRLQLKRGVIGVISDTHGLLRPEALSALKNAELIVHAGDIGNSQVIESLKQLAPVLAIRGNNDRGAWSRSLPDVFNLCVNRVKLQVIHNVHDLTENSLENGVRAVISGHSHMPAIRRTDEILYLNPGSAGPRRFRLPVALGMIYLHGQKIRARIIELQV